MSAILTEAVRLPMAAGVNVTLIEQLLPAATELPQVLVCAKSPGSAPVVLILLIVKLAFPMLVRVTDCAALVVLRFWLAKVREPLERLAVGALPVPVKATASGLLWRLSAMLIVAVRVPEAVGVNFAIIVQLALTPNELGQLFVWEKSLGSAPTMVKLEIVKLAVPVFDIVTLCTALEVPTVVVGNVKLEGERLTWPESPVPDRATD